MKILEALFDPLREARRHFTEKWQLGQIRQDVNKLTWGERVFLTEKTADVKIGGSCKRGENGLKDGACGHPKNSWNHWRELSKGVTSDLSVKKCILIQLWITDWRRTRMGIESLVDSNSAERAKKVKIEGKMIQFGR